MTVTRFESEVGDILRWTATRVKEAALDMHKAVVDELQIGDLDESYITDENISALVAGMQAFQGLLEHVRRLHANADGIDPDGGERFRAVVAPTPEPVAPEPPAADAQPAPMAPEAIAPEPSPPVEAPVVEAPPAEAPVVEAPIVEAPVAEAPPAEAPISSDAGALTEVVTEVPATPAPMFPEPDPVSAPVQGDGGVVRGGEPQVPDAAANEQIGNDAVAAPSEPQPDPAPVVAPGPELDFGNGGVRDEPVVEVNQPKAVEVVVGDQGSPVVEQPAEIQPAPAPTVDIPALEPVVEDVVAIEAPAEPAPVLEPILVEAKPEPVPEQVAPELPAEEVQNQDVPVTEEAPIQDLQAEEAPAAEAPAVEEVVQADPIALEPIPEAEPVTGPAPEQPVEILAEEAPLNAEEPAKIGEESKQV